MRFVIGIGNPDRGDDAAGLEVASRVRRAVPPGVTVRQVDGDPLTLLDVLLDARNHEADVYVVDAVCSGEKPGTVVRFDASRPLGTRFRHRGTHTFGLADVIELARALDGLPTRVAGYGIEGAAFEFGTGLSPRAESAVQSVTSQLLRDLNPVTKAPPSQDIRPLRLRMPGETLEVLRKGVSADGAYRYSPRRDAAPPRRGVLRVAAWQGHSD